MAKHGKQKEQIREKKTETKQKQDQMCLFKIY